MRTKSEIQKLLRSGSLKMARETGLEPATSGVTGRIFFQEKPDDFRHLRLLKNDLKSVGKIGKSETFVVSSDEQANRHNLHTENGADLYVNTNDKIDLKHHIPSNPLTLVVKSARKPPKTACKDGISPAELNRLEEAFYWLEKNHKRLVLITVADHDATETDVRKLIKRVRSDVVQLQGRCRQPKYWIEVLEGKQQVHSHIVACLPVAQAKRLKKYCYGAFLDITEVYDVKGLRNYLLKESTPQAAHGKGIRCNKGSQQLGKGGGDRVRMSKALKAKLDQAGLIQPYRRTYASRDLAS